MTFPAPRPPVDPGIVLIVACAAAVVIAMVLLGQF